MICSELCRTPLSVNVKMRMMKYWVKLLHGKNTELSYILYKLLCTLYTRNEGAKFKWIECIQGILQNCGLNFVCLSQNVENIESLLSFFFLQFERLISTKIVFM
jgi:hypothetical protein